MGVACEREVVLLPPPLYPRAQVLAAEECYAAGRIEDCARLLAPVSARYSAEDWPMLLGRVTQVCGANGLMCPLQCRHCSRLLSQQGRRQLPVP